MSGAAITSLVLICGLVWGGFLALLGRALTCEAGKRSDSAEGG